MGDTACEVHGAILDAYLAQGGPGNNPQTGRRHLGFPRSDETGTSFGARMSTFEWGAIYAVPGRGPVTVFGAPYQALKRAVHPLGLPILGNTKVAGGEAIYCERGCIWVTDAVPDGVLESVIDCPLLGRPTVLDIDEAADRKFVRLVTWPNVSNQRWNALTSWRPTVFAEIWDQRLALVPVNAEGQIRATLPLSQIAVSKFAQAATACSVTVKLEVQAGGAATFRYRQLYDLCLKVSPNELHAISPHCYYACRSWEKLRYPAYHRHAC
jgi:hypothetical protein